MVYWPSDIELEANTLAKLQILQLIAVGEYLQSTRASETVAQLIGAENEVIKKRSARIRVRTARRWLYRLGLGHKNVAK